MALQCGNDLYKNHRPSIGKAEHNCRHWAAVLPVSCGFKQQRYDLLPGQTFKETVKTMEARIAAAKCPSCGDGVFPSTLWGKGNLLDPPVVCRDMGHWVGLLSECSQ
jgi:hypothetical protein